VAFSFLLDLSYGIDNNIDINFISNNSLPGNKNARWTNILSNFTITNYKLEAEHKFYSWQCRLNIKYVVNSPSEYFKQ